MDLTLATVFIAAISGCGDSMPEAEAVAESRLEGAPSPIAELWFDEDQAGPYAIDGALLVGDTLLLLEPGSGDVWSVEFRESSTALALVHEGRHAPDVRAQGLLRWEGAWGILDRQGEVWGLGEEPFRRTPLVDWQGLSLLRIEDVVADTDPGVVAVVRRARRGAMLAPPVAVIEVLGIRPDNDFEVLATLAEGFGATFEAFTLAFHENDLHVFDILRSRRGQIERSGSMTWTPLASVVHRPISAGDVQALEARLEQLRDRAQGAGIAGQLPPTPTSRPSLLQVRFTEAGFLAVAEADDEGHRALDWYCNDAYRGTILTRATSIRFAEPYIVVVDQPEGADDRSRLRVFESSTITPDCGAP